MIPSNIILVGFMGSGKTTVGKALAKELEMSFVDADKSIVEKEGMPIPQIFESIGEEGFRKLERDFLETNPLENTVLATGGGMPCFKDNMTLLKKMGTVVYLKVNQERVTKRLLRNPATRPMLKLDEEGNLDPSLFTLLEEREEFYKKADLTIDASKSVSYIVMQIVKAFS